ncbi:LemA family protein [Candidatus Magnetominusculus xianensis]|uniref:Magnetosome protein MamQ-I n=1 Tax=Candidatus Magnetominusculus xianensis TaxID=1748249 RepID=A0ABR5SJN0_9BACT|nr:LemA family protein [Candidatus Magnetominusculus xianensis]KWT94839.1 magnetosome protein MamQ-I [Candidatus Magnetominusculus xianensis]MBF0404731.1 LemA family protein [Nitrospirota bacterium]
MTENDQLNDILKKVYAKDLGLLGDLPEISMRRKGFLSRISDKIWTRQSSAIKIAIVSLVLAGLSGAVYYYNYFTINVYQAMMEKAHIEAQLQRRADLIPNLISSANNYMSYEKTLFAHVAEVRSAVKTMELEAIEKSMASGGKPDASLDSKALLSKFQAVAEAYPALKASEAYNTLMKELSDTETKIAESRISYNRIANFYNSRLKMFPGNVFNVIFRFEPLPVSGSIAGAASAPLVH